MEVPQEIKNRTTTRFSILTSGIHRKKIKSLSWRGICTYEFLVALFSVAKIWKQTECPSIDEWIKKLGACIHTHTHTHIHTKECYWPLKEGNLAIALTWLDLESILLKEMSDKERQIPYDLTYMWNLKEENKYKIPDS